MNKKATFAIVAIVAIGIMLSAATVGAWGPIKPKPVPVAPEIPVTPETPPADTTVNALAGEITDVMGSEADEAAIASMLMQAQMLDIDLTEAIVMGDAAGADVSSSDVGIIVPSIANGGVHIWPYLGWPGPRIKTAIAWDECSNDLDMYHLAPFGLSISDAETTLTESSTMLNPFGIGLIIVHGDSVAPAGQPYVLVFDSY